MVDPESMRITVVSDNSPSGAVQLIEMFGLKFLKIHLNTVPKAPILGVQGSVLIEPVNNKLVEQVMVSCLNVKPLSKEDF